MTYANGLENNILLELLKYTHPFAFIAALLPIILAIIIWVGFSRSYHTKLKAITKDLNAIIEKIQEGDLGKPSIKNLDIMDDVLGEEGPIELKRPLVRAKRDAKVRGENSFLSEGQAYFTIDKTIKNPGGREYIIWLWLLIAVLGIMSRILPIEIALLVTGAPGGLSMLLGYSTQTLLGIGHIIFAIADYNNYKKATKAYEDFVNIFDETIPIAGELDGPALLIEATRENKEAFLESADRIEKAFDSFVGESIIPALEKSSEHLINKTVIPSISEIKNSLNQAMDAFSRRHESEMKFMVESFMTRLTDVMETKIHALGLSLGSVEKTMALVNAELENNIKGTKEMMEEQVSILKKAADLFDKTSHVQNQVKNMYITLDEKTEILTSTIGKIEENSRDQQEFSKKLHLNIKEMVEENKRSQTSFMEWEKASQAKLENITKAMNDAVLTAGKDLGKGLLEATGENAKAIEELTKLSEELRKDYDSYFGRIENSIKESLDDMTYHMQSLMAKITDETLGELKKILNQSREILTGYQDGTADLLNSFDEQARSISLYAKEMNYDINQLSETLKESVDGFTDSAKESINLTMSSFDSGLAELTKRIANTVESIVDAVENLPKAIEGDK